MFTQVDRNYNTSKVNFDETKSAPPSYMVDSSSPLSSVSIPSPPSVSPTPEMYSKELLYQNVSHLKVQNQTNGNTSMVFPNNISLVNSGVPPMNRMNDVPQRYTGENNSDSGRLRVSDVTRSIQDLKHFLLTAPSQFRSTDIIHQFRLPTEEQISCVRWNNAFCITGTDIVRILAYRFSLFGRDIVNRKKFEEGIFSDLRNLKINVDATLENPKSELLEFLYKRHCVRTKKKQKVFFWYSVRHDQLFIDALERELKKDAVIGSSIASSAQPPGSSSASTVSLRDPATSFKYDASLPIVEQLRDVCDTMVSSLANLVMELTTSNISTDYNPCQLRYSDSKLKSANEDVTIAPEDGNTPSTPVNQSVDKYNLDVSFMLTPYDKMTHLTPDKQDLNGSAYNFKDNHPGRERQNLYQPGQITKNNFIIPQGISSTSQKLFKNGYSKDDLYQTPPRDTSGRSSETMPIGSSFLIDPSKQKQSGPMQQQSNSIQGFTKYSDDLDASDFPLDVLIKEDESSVRYSDMNSSFQNKYTDFAHHNRPALTLQNSSNALLLNDSPINSMVQIEQSNVYPTQGYAILGNGNGLSGSVLPPQSPDWDQYIYSDSVNWGAARYSDSSPVQPPPDANSHTTSVVGDETVPYSFMGESITNSSSENRRDPLISKYFANSRVTKQYPTRKKSSHGGVFLQNTADGF